MLNKYKSFPFWSWNDELDEAELVKQIEWMHSVGIGGFFMHARGGLTTPYLGEKWFSCVDVCLKKAKELNMEAYAYDENGWPSGFAGGKLLKDLNNRDAYLTSEIGPYDSNSFVSYNIDGEKLFRVTKGEKVLNLYVHISTSTADICNKDVVKQFIQLTHEQYKKRDKYSNLQGFFTDEPQYYRWGTSWTRVLPDYYKKTYGSDILDELGLLFVNKSGYKKFRYRYWKSLQYLMLNSFSKQIYEWCDENNYKLTGHYVEETTLRSQIVCCGGVMPFYEYEHIPGIDWLGRDILPTMISQKQVSSVAYELGKEQVMCEMYACAGWDATPIELKRITDYLYVGGVNLMCQHLLPYSEHGQRKRDYPEHYSKHNPWVEKSFKEFNEYFNVLGEKLATSKEICNIGILNPIRSGYFEYQRFADFCGIKDLEEAYTESLTLIENNQLSYHILDEMILAKHGKVIGSSLQVGKYKYDYVILPKLIFNLDQTTNEILKEYTNNGGRILLLGEAPTYLEGEPYNFNYLKTNISFDEIILSQDFQGSFNKNIHMTYRIDKNGNRFIYAFNFYDSTDIEYKSKLFTSFECDGKVISNKVHFNKYEAKILYFSNKNAEPVIYHDILTLSNKFDIVKPANNFLTLDKLSYSSDGVIFTKDFHHMSVFWQLLNKRYSGDLYLKYSFDVIDIPSTCFALIEDTHLLDVSVNGVKIKEHTTVLEKDLWKFNVSKYIKKGHNEIVCKMNYYQSDYVYYVLFGKDTQESLKNCLAYDNTIEAIYLMGDFGVSGKFSDGKNDDIVIGNDFKIVKQPKSITHLIEDGFPFFRGEIVLSQIINVTNINQTLFIPKRFQTIEVKVNDKYVGKMMFSSYLDVSNYLVKGSNKIELTLTISNRNLLGPHHLNEQESFSVGPHTYERFGSWNEDGSSPLLKDDYAFVRTII